MKESIERYGYEALEAALRYRRELDWSVLPLRPPMFGDRKSGKQPAIRTWKQLTIAAWSEAEIRSFFGDDRDFNLGIVCGRVSGVVAVDADSQEAIDWVRRHLPVTPLVSRTGGGGEHHLYGWPGFEVRPGAKLRGMALDLRGDDSFIVAPPSRHASARNYRWNFEPTKEMLKGLPLFDPAWIADERTFGKSKIAVDPVESRLRVIRRAMRYIDKVEPAVAGQGGHNSLFRAVCKLLKPEPEGFGLKESEAWAIIASFNARCQPPFSDRDIEHKVSSVVSRIHKTIGG
jgi:hypothetical protein